MKIGAFILDQHQPTIHWSIGSVSDQVDDWILVHDSPVNKAINACFQMAESKFDYFVVLGGDTIHFPESIKTMMGYMESGTWSVMGRLVDYYRGIDGYGNHLYSTKELNGYRVDEADQMYDHQIHVHMKEVGKKKILTTEVIGVHHPTWTAKEVFEKFAFSGLRYPDKEYKKYLKQIEVRVIENLNPVNTAAYYAMQYGHGLREVGDKRPLASGMFKEAWQEYIKENTDGQLTWFL